MPAKVDPKARRSVIVTFKPKDQRPEKKKDKVEIVRTQITSEVQFLNTGKFHSTGWAVGRC